MEPKGHTFEFGAGKEIIDGKSHWPDCISIIIPKDTALEIASQIINQVRGGKLDIRFSGCGLLNYNEPQD